MIPRAHVLKFPHASSVPRKTAEKFPGLQFAYNTLSLSRGTQFSHMLGNEKSTESTGQILGNTHVPSQTELGVLACFCFLCTLWQCHQHTQASSSALLPLSVCGSSTNHSNSRNSGLSHQLLIDGNTTLFYSTSRLPGAFNPHGAFRHASLCCLHHLTARYST